MIRVMIVAKHAEVREGLRTVLGLAEGITLAAVISSIGDVTDACAACPEVALVDMDMPQAEGCEIIRQILRVCPHTKILALTAHDYDLARDNAVHAGASQVIVKGQGGMEMAAAIQQAVKNT